MMVFGELEPLHQCAHLSCIDWATAARSQSRGLQLGSCGPTYYIDYGVSQQHDRAVLLAVAHSCICS